VQQNLDLLREQYVRLQGRYNELEQKHNKVLASQGGGAGKEDGYISRLIAMANNLYDKPLFRYVPYVGIKVGTGMCNYACCNNILYAVQSNVIAIFFLNSDVVIKLSDRQLPGHRLILATRSSHWDSQDDRMSSTKEIDLSSLTPNVATAIIKWVYTNQVYLPQDEVFVIETLVGAERYKLTELKEK